VWHARRAPRPLIDVGLFRSPAFSAASLTTFMLGGALFGAMIVLPLYYQVARGESALTAGLLMAPQGVGAAMVMPVVGRLTDRIGGGPIAVVGLTVMTVATIPFAFIGPDTPYGLLAGLLVVRGMGLGSTMMPTMAAAYAVLSREAVPRATSAVNIVRQVGGSLGTAILAVVLQHQIASNLPAGRGQAGGGGAIARLPEDVRARVAAPLADAFAHTFWWAVAMSLLALPAAILLARTTRGARRAPQPPAEEAAPLEHV
jgi:MFS family permease